MRIKKIKISNFKSFDELELELGDLSVLIGANASGKSNLAEIFRFAGDLARSGLENAISLQGGAQYLRNIALGRTKDFALQITYDCLPGMSRIFRNEEAGRGQRLRVFEIVYELTIEFIEAGPGFRVREERAICGCELIELEKGQVKHAGKSLGLGQVRIERKERNLVPVIDLPLAKIMSDEDIIQPLFRDLTIEPGASLLGFAPFFLPVLDFVEFLRGIPVYDIHPKLSKKAAPTAGRADLDEDGSNLALILKGIIRDEESRRKLTNLVADALPFVTRMSVEEFLDKSLLVTVEEMYAPNQPLPAFLISDGTINITALVVALFLKPKPFVIIEEPERNIHPHLISKVADMLKEASVNSQVLVTTHSPELAKHVPLEDLLLISRDENGFSVISRPSGNDRVRIFLKNEIGIDELHIQNLLGSPE